MNAAFSVTGWEGDLQVPARLATKYPVNGYNGVQSVAVSCRNSSGTLML